MPSIRIRRLRKATSFPWLIILAVAFLWVFINGAAVLSPRFWSREMGVAYAVILTVFGFAFLLWAHGEGKLAQIRAMTSLSVGKALFSFMFGFVLTLGLMFVLLIQLAGFVFDATLSTRDLTTLVLVQVLVVAFVETISWQVMLAEMVGKWWSQLGFAGFHYAVAGFNVNTFLLFFLLGFIWRSIIERGELAGSKWIVNPYNTAMTMGSHSAYNISLWLFLPAIVGSAAMLLGAAMGVGP
jgi:hypothetical protein